MVKALLYMAVCVPVLAFGQTDSVQSGPEASLPTDTTEMVAPLDTVPAPEPTRTAVLEGRSVVASARRTADGVRRISREELVRAGSLGQVLAREPGVLVHQTGGLGSWTQMQVRGAPSSQTEVFLDGVPLGGSSGSTVDLGPIPVDGLDWIELRHAGDAGASGAPRLDLRSRSGWARMGASVRQGSFGEQGVSVFGGDPAGKTTVSAWFERADNDYPFQWNNGTLTNTTDDFVVKLGNNDYQGMGVAAGWRPLESVQILSRWESSDKGVTSPTNPDPDARFAKDAIQTQMSWESTEGMRRHAEVSGRWHSSEWADPERSADYSVSKGMHESGRDFRAAVGLGATDAAWLMPDLEATTRYESSDRRSSGGVSSSPDGSRLSLDGRLGLQAGPPEGGWGVDFGGVAGWKRDGRDYADRMSTQRDTSSISTDWWSGNGRVRIWLTPTAAITAWIAAEQSRRVPEFSEWMGDNGFILPNPDLVAERALGAEGVAQYKRSEWLAKLSIWTRRFEHPIALVSRGSGPMGVYENGFESRLYGLDGDVSYCRDWGWVRTSATLQQARQSDPNPYLDGKWPRWTPAAKGHLEGGVTPTRWLQAGYSLDFRGEVFIDESNEPSSRRPGRILHGAWISGAWKTLRMTFSVANLTDEPTRDWEALPLAGRRLLARLDWNPTNSNHEGEYQK